MKVIAEYVVTILFWSWETLRVWEVTAGSGVSSSRRKRISCKERFYRWLHGNAPAPQTKEADVLVKLPQGVPIYLTYITQEADAGGKLASRGDPYGWDGRPDRQLAASTYTSPTRGAP